jgi:tRNA G18 (ribose-2'-O)-methylase SpoU
MRLEVTAPAAVVADPRNLDVLAAAGWDGPTLWREAAEAPPPAGLALWHVVDPGNVGTIVRTAHALGPAFLALSSGCGDPTGTKALRASAGSIFHVPLGRFEDAPGRRVALSRMPVEPRPAALLGTRQEIGNQGPADAMAS